LGSMSMIESFLPLGELGDGGTFKAAGFLSNL
jgi:hypothetical protein